jgi:DNA-binding NtrC family response regulator
MLFMKSEGRALGLADWVAQAGPEGAPTNSDFFAEAANATWKAILQDRVSYAQACIEIEKRVLETAISVPGSTRRQIAQRLRTSERTLYYKLRAHGIGCSPDPGASPQTLAATVAGTTKMHS